MRKIILGAAGLLLSGTAMAGVTSKAVDSTATAVPVAAKDADGLNESTIGNAMLIDWPAKSAAQDKAIDESKVIEASVQAKPETAAAEAPSTSKMSEAAATDDMTGMGGPDEPVTTAATASPVTTETSWPACSPGPGDDNCIQLYEPGVRAAYATWQAASLPGATQTGMGGPEEPVHSASGVKSGYKLAAYDEPLPEDLVMPASNERAEADVSKDDTLAL